MRIAQSIVTMAALCCASMAWAGANCAATCGAKKDTTKVAATSCVSKTAVAGEQVAASSCADKSEAKLVSSDKKSCAAKCSTDAKLVSSDKKSCAATCASKGEAKLASDEKKSCATGKTVADAKACSPKYVSKASCAAECSGKVASGAPTMMFVVADQKVGCPDKAAELAKSHDGAKIKYVVDGEMYCDHGKALEAYATTLSRYYDSITEVAYVVGDESTYCHASAKAMAKSCDSKAMKYRVANVTFECAAAAKKASLASRKAADDVTMKCMVGDKEYACSTQAKMACSAKGDKVMWAVGDTKTACEHTAKVAMLRAKIDAALKAAEQIASADAETPARG